MRYTCERQCRGTLLTQQRAQRCRIELRLPGQLALGPGRLSGLRSVLLRLHVQHDIVAVARQLVGVLPMLELHVHRGETWNRLLAHGLEEQRVEGQLILLQEPQPHPLLEGGCRQGIGRAMELHVSVVDVEEREVAHIAQEDRPAWPEQPPRTS